MRDFLEIKDMSRFKACLALLPIAGGDGTGDDPDGGGGVADSASDPAPDTKVEVSEKEYKDLKGFRESAGDDFDPKKWSALKGYDPAKVAENMEFGSAVEKDAMMQAVLSERIAAKKEGRKMSMAKIMEQFKDELDNPNEKKDPAAGKTAVDPKVAEHDAWIRQQEEEKVVKAFDEGLEKELTTQKLKLSGKESGYLKKLVTETYIGNHKLTMADLPKVVKDAAKEILEYRKELQAGWTKEISGDGEETEDSPAPISGTPAQPGKKGYDPRKATSADRVGAIANEMRDMGYGR